MDNFFDIAVIHNSKNHVFSAQFITTAYSYKIEVNFFGKIISFEPDEERNFRAIINTSEVEDTQSIDMVLLQEIGNQLIILFKN